MLAGFSRPTCRVLWIHQSVYGNRVSPHIAPSLSLAFPISAPGASAAGHYRVGQRSSIKTHAQAASVPVESSPGTAQALNLQSMVDKPNRAGRELSQPFIVGVAGGTASGKTTVCDKIAAGLRKGIQDEDSFVLIPQDSFYRNLTPEEAANVASYNFDHPDAFAFDEMVACLKALKMGQPVSIPMYDYTTNARKEECTYVKHADVVLFDGILAFHNKELTDLMDLKVFVDVDSDIRLARRIRRDIVHRGRDVIKVLDQYEATVKPSHDAFVYPTRAAADIIVPRGAENQPAIDLVLQLLKAKLAARVAAREREASPVMA